MRERILMNRLLLIAASLPFLPSFCVAEKLVISKLADPSVVKASDGNYYATGTYDDNNLIKIYRSPDLGVTSPFSATETYDPSSFGDPYRYCWNWAAEISYHDGRPRLLFSGVRAPKKSPCPPPDNLALFTAESSGLKDGRFNFGAPRPISFPGVPNAPYSNTGSASCPPQGCDRALRIDGNYFTDPNTGRTWLNYVWFQDGCHVAGVDLAEPGKVVRFADPTYAVEHGYRDVVAEGPNVFVRGGKYYFLFSHNRFDETYGTSYYMADSFSDFKSGGFRYRLTDPVVNRSGRILRNSGHGMVAALGDDFYYIYHVGKFANGKYTGRDTYIAPLAFAADGRIKNLTAVDIGWSEVPGAQYSLDIITRTGEKIAPCVDAGIIDRDLGTVYEGYCPSARDRLVDKSDIASFQLCYAFGGNWANASCVSKAYDGKDDSVDFKLTGKEGAEPETPVDMVLADAPAESGPTVSGLEDFFGAGRESFELREEVWQGLQGRADPGPGAVRPG